VLDLNDVAAIADFIVDFNGIGGKKGQANDTA